MPDKPFDSLKNDIFAALQPDKVVQQISKQADKLFSEQQRDELQRSIQIIMQSSLSKLDLVTREEFDTQAAILAKTRAKAERLEAELNQLLAELDQKNTP